MAGLLEEYFPTIIISFTVLVVAATAFVKYNYGYWKRKGVPYFEPKFPFGNSDTLFPKGISIGLISKKFYDQFKSTGQKIGGVFMGIQPYLIVLDPEIVKDVLIKDFQYFTDRGVYHTESDPLSVHLFSQEGLIWRNTRVSRPRTYNTGLTITWVCTKDYIFKNSDVTVDKGTPLMISVTGLHHDPEYWPDPDRWDPDRFSEENKQKRQLLTFLPFGDGPRNCIGLRFGLLQTKVALITTLTKYRVTLSPKTITPLGRDPATFALRPKNKIYLRFEKI
ncbi:probable cytochrome P450 6a14 [Anoplophora glabripennis]|uniref:probable cytochrome P450 6a14 n=1 Tax=Anoplophora glabripennis TaxID=217634 RepID=UPI000C776472|nr:probable cytochrome P450 6a14 [Anoplophora glabripennis]